MRSPGPPSTRDFVGCGELLRREPLIRWINQTKLLSIRSSGQPAFGEPEGNMKRIDFVRPKSAGGPFSRITTLLIAATLGLAVSQAAAEGWPARPIRIINALAAGSAPDLLSRIIAEPLS